MYTAFVKGKKKQPAGPHKEVVFISNPLYSHTVTRPSIKPSKSGKQNNNIKNRVALHRIQQKA
jgi:hypothetical protein